MKTFTVFSTDASKATIHITAVQARNAQSATKKGRAECAYDWSCSTDDILVLGVCAGDVEVVEWDDNGL